MKFYQIMNCLQNLILNSNPNLRFHAKPDDN